jgi:hypothetical protein
MEGDLVGVCWRASQTTLAAVYELNGYRDILSQLEIASDHVAGALQAERHRTNLQKKPSVKRFL